MSLDWNLSKIKNWQTLCFEPAKHDDPTRGITKGDRRLNPVTDALIFACPIIDLGGITEKNKDEFWGRISLFEKLNGTILNGWDERSKKQVPYPLKYEDIEAHVGLSCNVIDKTRSQWQKRLVDNWMAKVAFDLKRARREREAREKVAAGT